MTIDGISAKDPGVFAFGAPERSGGERSESERSGGAPKAAASRRGAVPEPEVPAVPSVDASQRTTKRVSFRRPTLVGKRALLARCFDAKACILPN